MSHLFFDITFFTGICHKKIHTYFIGSQLPHKLFCSYNLLHISSKPSTVGSSSHKARKLTFHESSRWFGRISYSVKCKHADLKEKGMVLITQRRFCCFTLCCVQKKDVQINSSIIFKEILKKGGILCIFISEKICYIGSTSRRWGMKILVPTFKYSFVSTVCSNSHGIMVYILRINFSILFSHVTFKFIVYELDFKIFLIFKKAVHLYAFQ